MPVIDHMNVKFSEVRFYRAQLVCNLHRGPLLQTGNAQWAGCLFSGDESGLPAYAGALWKNVSVDLNRVEPSNKSAFNNT